MSRCFPFPRTGKLSSNEALIVSIKLQEGRENSIPDRAVEKLKPSDKKDRKREKKDKKKDKDSKRDKEKFQSALESEKLKQNDKLNKADSVPDERKAKRSFEALEQSNLTEEHDRPVDVQNVSCSSDSTGATGNSSKRRRHSSPANSIQGKRNIIRIRLSSKRRDDPCTSASIPQEDNSTLQSKLPPLEPSNGLKDVMPKAQEPFIGHKHVISKAQEPSVGQKHVMSNAQEPSVGQKHVMFKSQEPSVGRKHVMFKSQESSLGSKDLMHKVQRPFCSPKEVMPKAQESLPVASTSTVTLGSAYDKKTESVAPREGPSSSGRIESSESPLKKLSSHEKKMLKIESMYTKLFENLSPSKLESGSLVDQDDDDDWLFGNKLAERPTKRLRGSSDAAQANLACSASAVLQPRAHFLSDVGIYALPFTILF